MGVAGVLWATGVLALAAEVEEAFPYTATIAHEAVLVRCGPGEGFYSTCRLLKGAEVEVHRHGPHGWCAIRPPEGEFCLVAAEQVELLPGDDLVEVMNGETTVWIGSHLAKPDPHCWQIHLQRGERADVIGVRAGGGEEGKAAAWYKIAPPAGEFRWVPGEALARAKASPDLAGDDISPQELPADLAAAAKPLAGPANYPESNEPHGDVLPMPDGSPEFVDESRAVVARASLASESEDEPLPVAGSEANADPKDSRSPPVPSFSEVDVRIKPQPRSQESETGPAPAPSPDAENTETAFEAEATALQVDLTLAVAQDLSRWRLGPVRDRAIRLRDSAPSAPSRQQAENLLAAIERFEQLYTRYLRYAESRAASVKPLPRY